VGNVAQLNGVKSMQFYVTHSNSTIRALPYFFIKAPSRASATTILRKTHIRDAVISNVSELQATQTVVNNGCYFKLTCSEISKHFIVNALTVKDVFRVVNSHLPRFGQEVHITYPEFMPVLDSQSIYLSAY
jgi:hypothetical protein